MNNGILYVLCGIPGSGKSTWIQNHMNPTTEKWVSRDTIRFSLVAENQEYFSQESKVFKEFITEINQNLKKGYNVYADATHLNPQSRNKLLRGIFIKPSSLECIFIQTPLEEAIKRNENRQGIRSYVPPTVIRNMYSQLTKPSLEEGFDKIYIIQPNKPIEIWEESV